MLFELNKAHLELVFMKTNGISIIIIMADSSRSCYTENMFQNAIDAINKTGASVKGFADGNKNDLALVQNFYILKTQEFSINTCLSKTEGIMLNEQSN